MEKTTRGAGIACSSYANCYVGCSCNTSNGWYSSCSSAGGTDCKSVTDTRYTGVNAMSASNVGDINSLTDGKSAQSTSGNTQVVSLSGGVSTMSSSGATTCYKKKTCEEGGYYSSVPTDQKCSSKKYNEYTCYTSCSYKTCSDYGYKSSQPSGQTCTAVTPRSGLTCYKDCKDNYNPCAYKAPNEEYICLGDVCSTDSNYCSIPWSKCVHIEMSDIVHEDDCKWVEDGFNWSDGSTRYKKVCYTEFKCSMELSNGIDTEFWDCSANDYMDSYSLSMSYFGMAVSCGAIDGDPNNL